MDCSRSIIARKMAGMLSETDHTVLGLDPRTYAVLLCYISNADSLREETDPSQAVIPGATKAAYTCYRIVLDSWTKLSSTVFSGW